jgi:fatty acid desaturase
LAATRRLRWHGQFAGLVPTVLIIEFAFGIPIWLYALTSVYLGIALIAVRSFCEHQWSERADGRTIIVERSVLAPLFLNNNLHFVHHKLPTVPWYRLPALYRERREDWLAMNEGYVFRSYFDVIKAFSFRAKEPVVHPALRCGEAKMTVRIEEATPIFSFADEIPVPEMR